MNACAAQAFIDYQGIDWSQVKRSRLLFHQHFQYNYPGPIRALQQRLVVIPPERYGAQRLCSHRLTATPAPCASRSTTDAFGNRVVEVEITEAGESVAFGCNRSHNSTCKLSSFRTLTRFKTLAICCLNRRPCR